MAKPKEDKNVLVPINILKELLTPSEIRMLKNRWQIIQLLEQGLSIRKVAEQVRVGTDTVVRVARMMEKGELKNILDTDREVANSSSKTSWIFGKGKE